MDAKGFKMSVGQNHKMNSLCTKKCGTKITEELLEVLF